MSFYFIAKRIIDIVGSLFGIILFSPFLLGTAIWIKLVSPKGPIFADIPPRAGKDQKPFFMYKFRSMVPNAHQWLLDHPDLYKQYVENDYKLDPDPRWLLGAQFLRKSSIDELPQFFNILKGEMSLVGPRAYYPFEVDAQLQKYPDAKKYLDKALTVKPGLTGVWQVSGRNALSFEKRAKLDAAYAESRSILYDLLIILKTPLAVLSSKGAH